MNNNLLKKNGIKKIDPYIASMTIPFFILMCLFTYVPLWGWIIGFIDYIPGLSIFEAEFVGLKYFALAFGKYSSFWNVIRNTLAMSLLNILVTPLPIILAIMLTELRNRSYKKIVQTVTAFPHFVSWIIVYSLFFALFSVDDGIINNILIKINVLDRPFDLLGSAKLTWFFQTFASSWKTAGYSAIIYIAAISSIDKELYSAASIDGASTFQQILHITVPGIIPTYRIILLISIGFLLSNGFEQYFVFSNPLNLNMIDVLDTYTYRIGIVRFNFSLATAVGVFKSVVSIILITVSNKIFKLAFGSSII